MAAWSIFATLLGASCKPIPRQAIGPPSASPEAHVSIDIPPPTPAILATSMGVATWYDVPAKSLPARRAPGELTAASDHLPMGSLVRVVNLSNDLSVIVRITDTGVHRARAIDLCKEAALEIGLVGKGVAKVRIERLAPAEDHD